MSFFATHSTPHSAFWIFRAFSFGMLGGTREGSFYGTHSSREGKRMASSSRLACLISGSECLFAHSLGLGFFKRHKFSLGTHYSFRLVAFDEYFSTTPHQAPAVFGFLACVSTASGTGGSYGPQITRIWKFENPKCTSAWDPDPDDPRGVPRDQKFFVKIFLIS